MPPWLPLALLCSLVSPLPAVAEAPVPGLAMTNPPPDGMNPQDRPRCLGIERQPAHGSSSDPAGDGTTLSQHSAPDPLSIGTAVLEQVRPESTTSPASGAALESAARGCTLGNGDPGEPAEASPERHPSRGREGIESPEVADQDCDETGQPTELPQPLSLVLTVRSEFSPYDRVRYEIKLRGGTLIATLTKSLVQGYGELTGLGLASLDEARGLLDQLDACGLRQLSREPAGPSQPTGETYELEVQLGSFTLHSVRDATEVIPYSPFWCVVTAITESYDRFGEPVPFRNLFYQEGEYGELSADSVPAARVFIDDRDTGLDTPVFRLPLEVGVHTIRFVNQPLGIDRRYNFTIVAGLTTRLEVELR
ncbi:MAG: hypothetical protein JW797_01010 [Bradymonadales bacterium]|nr:hypothetical protein [Bradymonadales bacterium]